MDSRKGTHKSKAEREIDKDRKAGLFRFSISYSRLEVQISKIIST